MHVNRLAQRLSIPMLIAFALVIYYSQSGNVSSGAYERDLFKSEVHCGSIANQPYDQPIIIESDGDFQQQGWPGLGLANDPYVIEDLELVARHNGITVRNTTAHFILRNIDIIHDEFFSGNGPGIILWNVTHATIIDCTIESMSYGIILRNTSEIIVRESNFGDQVFAGLWLEESGHILLENNYVTECNNAVMLEDSVSCTVMENILFDTSIGIEILSANRSHIANNTVFSNSVGLLINSGANTTVINNTIYGNSNLGVTVEAGSNCTLVYGNRIGWNAIAQAKDEGDSTEWNSTTQGNAWSDYSGEGPYQISGSKETEDKLPYTLTDKEPPQLNHLGDQMFEEGSQGHRLEWYFEEAFPMRLECWKDDELIFNLPWDGSGFSLSLNGLTAGLNGLGSELYRYKLQVWDASGNSTLDIVEVIVFPSEAPILQSISDLEYVVGSTGNRLQWTPFDLFPDRYSIYRDGELIQSGFWNNSMIYVSVDGLEVGLHIYTLYVLDEVGNLSKDSVSVRVLPRDSEIGEDHIYWALMASAGLTVALMAYLGISRRRRVSAET